MRHDKLERELNLLMLLTENHNYTVPDICDRIGISRRNLYYYLEFFRDAGFIVENNKPFYRIRKDSPFFKKIDAIIHFSEDEALTIRNILERVDDKGPQVQRIKQKLDRLYDFRILNDEQLREQQAHNVSVIYEAIKLERCVMLKNYSSPHSNTRRNRIVEPFLFMNGNREVRCYEPASQMNKTFKLARIEEAVMSDVSWSHKDRHKQVFTDIFTFSDEQLLPVKLRLGRLACSLLREEYPQAERYITQEDEQHWLVEMNVCSYTGIGRFILGLYDDIEVLGGDGLKHYMTEKINQLYHKQSSL
jgi:predicted DNA-binding transcriptional regulator YafY